MAHNDWLDRGAAVAAITAVVISIFSILQTDRANNVAEAANEAARLANERADAANSIASAALDLQRMGAESEAASDASRISLDISNLPEPQFPAMDVPAATVSITNQSRRSVSDVTINVYSCWQDETNSDLCAPGGQDFNKYVAGSLIASVRLATVIGGCTSRTIYLEALDSLDVFPGDRTQPNLNVTWRVQAWMNWTDANGTRWDREAKTFDDWSGPYPVSPDVSTSVATRDTSRTPKGPNYAKLITQETDSFHASGGPAAYDLGAKALTSGDCV